MGGIAFAAVDVMASFVEKHFTVDFLRSLSYRQTRRMKCVCSNDCISTVEGWAWRYYEHSERTGTLDRSSGGFLTEDLWRDRCYKGIYVDYVR